MITLALTFALQTQSDLQRWKPNDESRPLPRVVSAGRSSTQEKAGVPPSDAIVLFNGVNLNKWQSLKGTPAPWKVSHGHMEIVPLSGDFKTKDKFGDCQLHVEWRTPTVLTGDGQKRGNSGVYLMTFFEVQVLDSF